MPHPLCRMIEALYGEPAAGRSLDFMDEKEVSRWAAMNHVKPFEVEFIGIVVFQSFNLWSEFIQHSNAAMIYLTEVKPMMDSYQLRRLKAIEEMRKEQGIKPKPARPSRKKAQKMATQLTTAMFPGKTTAGHTVCPKCKVGHLFNDDAFILCDRTPACDYVEVA